MPVFAIADLHLSFGVPEKSMELFGPVWKDYAQKIEKNWREKISQSDLVLIAGDISWAMKPLQAKIDLDWIEALPGEKVLLRGNHDYWWGSLSSVEKILPESCHIIQNNAFEWNGISIGGSKLYDSDEFNFENCIEIKEGKGRIKARDEDNDRRLFERELLRLEMSLKCLDQKASHRVAMTHYPPIGPFLKPTQTHLLFEKYNVDTVVFGHLHNVKEGSLSYGLVGSVKYVLTSADYIHFNPVQIL